MFSRPQKTVLYAPFRSRPTPAWFATRGTTGRKIFKKLVEFEALPSPWKVPAIIMTKLARLVAPDIPSDANQATRIADYMAGKATFIYGVPNITAGIAMRWKEQTRAATGQLVAAYELPDVIANEPSLSFPDLILGRQMVFLRDRDENHRVCRKFQELAELNKDVIPKAVEIYGEGTSKLSRICSLAYLGDFVTAYLGLKRNRRTYVHSN